MTAQVVNVHVWPGRGGAARSADRQRRTVEDAERLVDRPGVAFVAAAEREQVPERWGLGVALAFTGRTTTGATLVVADDLHRRDPGTLASLKAWASTATLDTPGGPRPVHLTTRRGALDPDHGCAGSTYKHRRWLVTADEGRSLGLAADWWGPARGRFAGGFTLGLAGSGHLGPWVEKGKHRQGWRARLHEPVLRVKALGAHGLAVEFGKAGRGGLTPDGAPAGCWERQGGRLLPSRGRVLDLIGPAHTFDGQDTGDLSDHLAAFGLDPVDVPAAVAVTPGTAARLLTVALAVHGLALALDAEASQWLTTEHDRAQGIGRVDLRRCYSPGSLAGMIRWRGGATPPLAKFAEPDDAELGRYSAAAHGGIVTATVRGQVVPVADGDFRQAYVAAEELLGLGDLIGARRLVRVDRTAWLRQLAEPVAAGNVERLYERATYAAGGITRVELVPDDGPWLLPVERPTATGPRFDLVPVQGAEPFDVSWPDFLGAVLFAGRVPATFTATGWEPDGFGAEDGLRPVPLRAGVVVPAGANPGPYLARMRPAKGTGETLQRACIRGVANPLSWGLAARLDQRRVGGKLREHPASWTWPPAAATIPAVVRLWLALVRRGVEDAGGAVVACDTDGLAAIAAPEPGAITLHDGRKVAVLSHEQVRGIWAPFDRLDAFGDGLPAASVDVEHEGRPLFMLSLRPKKYVLAVAQDGGRYRAVGGTVHGLVAVAPPVMPGRDADRRPAWSWPVAQHALDVATGHAQGWRAPWDAAGEAPWPVMRRFSAGSPDALAGLPGILGAHPFAPLVEGHVDRLFCTEDAGAPITLDPGDDALLPSVAWWRGDGQRVRVTTNPRRGSADVLVLRSLAAWCLGWCRPEPVEVPGVLDFDRRLVRRVGRGGALIDALLADPTADPAQHQVVYDEGDGPAFVAELVGRMGRKPFAAAFNLPPTTVNRIARGARADTITTATVLDAVASGAVRARACPSCGGDVFRPGATYCSGRCRERVKARRKRAGDRARPGCQVPGCDQPARARSRTCSEAHKKVLARRSAPALAVVGPSAVTCPGCAAEGRQTELVGLAATRGMCRRCHERGVAA